MTQQEFDDAMKRRIKTIIAIGLILSVIGFIILISFDDYKVAVLLFVLAGMSFGAGLGLATTMVSYYNYRGYER